MLNTFVLSVDHHVTADLLDRQRLGKQRVEAKQIINILEHFDNTQDNKKAWFNHPVCQMWIGYTEHLKKYFNIISGEWVARGYKHNMGFYAVDEEKSEAPYWIAWPELRYSHMASLFRKDPREYWGRFEFPCAYNEFGYVWPTHLSSEKVAKLNDGITMNLQDVCDPISKSITKAQARRTIENKEFYLQMCNLQSQREALDSKRQI